MPTAPPPPRGTTEVECLRACSAVAWLPRIPISANKSQVGHSLGAAAAIEAALGIEAMQQGIVLPTVNHIPDPEFADIDVVPNQAAGMPRILPLQLVRFRRHQLLHRLQRSVMRPKPFVPEPLDGPDPYVRDTTGLVWHRCELRTLYADTDRSRSCITPITCATSNSAGPR
jgi:hypothetical protein